MDDELIKAMQAKTDALGLRRKPGDTKPPGLLQRAVNFAGAVTRHVMHGLPVVSDEEKERRLGICRLCPQFIADSERCSKCGCAMRTKAAWALERCPLQLW